MKKIPILLAICVSAAFFGCGGAATGCGETPAWLEADSAKAVASRLRADFTLTLAEAAEQIRTMHPEVSDADIDEFIEKHYIEVKTIDDTLRVHRKSPRNLKLLNPAMNGGVCCRGESASDARISYVDSVLDWYGGRNPEGRFQRVKYRFTVDVPYNEAIAGDTLRVWMPFPLETQRQREVMLHSAYPAEYILSDTARTVHSTIYFEAPAPLSEGDTAHFEYVGSYIACGEYFSPAEIRAKMRSYDTRSENYRRYTAFEAPHIVRLDSLARCIVGDETDPLICSEKVYDYIVTRYLWAGAREYSTISSIPEYVLREGHGDCGQVSLLYISLMRSLGIPARWESGWMLHPGEKNLHDWAEVYFEGVGWVPVDVSFGRYLPAKRPEAVRFYSTGMDAHRFASNRGVCGALDPAKRFIRSETVDFQLGEVECSRGNLFYPAWDSHFEIIDKKAIR